ncbi:MAG: hypothetical protein ACXW2U_04310 [Telluria sp.]
MKILMNRLYSDYLMPSRLGQYEALLQQAAGLGYTQQTLRDFHASMDCAHAPPRVLVNRHDIDSDLRTARKMFAIETRLGVKASYYFRLSTLDFGFMREIEAYGSEASYHYEEVADFAKRHHIKDPDEVRRRFPQIRELFLENYQHIARRLGRRMATVASHGDFANRRLKVINHELLRDSTLRQRCGIACESYDDELLRNFDMYISDKPFPQYYHPMPLSEALGKHARICFLTHPVQWETNWTESTRCNVRRLYEEMTW